MMEQEPHDIYDLPFYGGEVPGASVVEPAVESDLWPDVTPVNPELALVWKVLMILATFPWWVGVAYLVMVGW